MVQKSSNPRSAVPVNGLQNTHALWHLLSFLTASSDLSKGRPQSANRALLCSPYPNTLSHRPPPRENLRHSLYGLLDIFSLAHRRCTVGLHSALNTFFQTTVSGHEKRSRMQERMSGSCLVTFFLSPILFVESTQSE